MKRPQPDTRSGCGPARSAHRAPPRQPIGARRLLACLGGCLTPLGPLRSKPRFCFGRGGAIGFGSLMGVVSFLSFVSSAGRLGSGMRSSSGFDRVAVLPGERTHLGLCAADMRQRRGRGGFPAFATPRWRSRAACGHAARPTRSRHLSIADTTSWDQLTGRLDRVSTIAHRGAGLPRGSISNTRVGLAPLSGENRGK